MQRNFFYMPNVQCMQSIDQQVWIAHAPQKLTTGNLFSFVTIRKWKDTNIICTINSTKQHFVKSMLQVQGQLADDGSMESERTVWCAMNTGSICILSVQDKCIIAEFEAHIGDVTCLVESKNSVFSGGIDGTVAQWDLFTHSKLATFVCTTPVLRLLQHNNGNDLLVLCKDNILRVYDLLSCKCTKTTTIGNNAIVDAVLVNRLALWIAIENVIFVYDLSKSEIVHELHHKKHVTGLLHAQSYVLSYGEDVITIWNVDTCTPVKRITGIGDVKGLQPVAQANVLRLWSFDKSQVLSFDEMLPLNDITEEQPVLHHNAMPSLRNKEIKENQSAINDLRKENEELK